MQNASYVYDACTHSAPPGTFLMVQNVLAMLTIGTVGDEEQKQRFLPGMARLEKIGCWGLTEPDFGSDASSLATTARKVEGGWLLNGAKRWIGNGTFADVSVIWARNTGTGEINAFVVEKGAPGFHTSKIENKIALRCVQNADMQLQDVFVPDRNRLSRCDSFKDTNKVLAASRIAVAWCSVSRRLFLPIETLSSVRTPPSICTHASKPSRSFPCHPHPLPWRHPQVGMAMGVYDVAKRYLSERRQFGATLDSMQLSQEKLSRILGNVQAMAMSSWRMTRLFEEGRMTHAMVSLCKAWNSLRGRECVALARELLGGNGIVADYHVAKAFSDMEVRLSCEKLEPGYSIVFD